MTSQVTNRRERGLVSCSGRSEKFLALHRGWWWRELKEANKPPSRPKYIHKNGAKIAVFCSKVLNKIYSQDFLEEYIDFKIFHYF
jgi:hypothetical protein